MRRSAAPSQSASTGNENRFFSNNKKPRGFNPPYKVTITNEESKANRPTLIYGIHKPDTKENIIYKKDIPQKETFQNKKRTSLDLLELFPSKQQKLECKPPSFIVQPQKSRANEFIPKPIGKPTNLVAIQSPILKEQNENTKYFSVVWCKLSKKKHKKWEGDAILIVKNRSVTLKDMEGKTIGQGTGYKLADLSSLDEGNTLPIGGKEIEIQGSISADKYISGQCFQSGAAIAMNEIPVKILNRPKYKPFCLPTRYCIGSLSKAEKKPLYDASHQDAIVMPRPPSTHQWKHNTQSLAVIDVVIDPHIAKHLRPHQRDGVIFLYECVMGYRIKECHGAILADEMGLGKTLQCIALIWMLLKQGPYGCVPCLKTVLIITPSSICANWGQEFQKWVSNQRVKPFIVDQQNKVEDFLKQRLSPIMIISYEMAVRNIDLLKRVSFDLLLCDEGHRLKNCGIKTTSVLMSLDIKKRIIATGTPLQNDMHELFALVEFVNPGILGSSAMFKRVYEEAIIKSKQPNASPDEILMGDLRAVELNKLSSQFTLRRTQEIINRYLPPKTECVIFCRPTESQTHIYSSVVRSKGLQRCFTELDSGTDHLAAICILRKLCNHPALLLRQDSPQDPVMQSEIQKEAALLVPQEIQRKDIKEEDSGKLAVVSCMLWLLSESKREKVVIVSNFTSTLDMLQQICQKYQYSFLRLDGSTATSKRQGLVNRFNSPQSNDFIFLLSAKAGGVGINLIGASRIILFDIDWNPATDLQSMARVWRDGQKKPVFIYRLLLTGSIEEKMYQRQVCKQGISGSVVDARINSKVKFSKEDLKDLFQFSPDVECLTHESLDCPCNPLDGELFSKPIKLDTDPVKSNSTTMDQLDKWQHFSMPTASHLIKDEVIEAAVDFISFVFKSYTSA